jgi:hypothetical protein
VKFELYDFFVETILNGDLTLSRTILEHATEHPRQFIPDHDLFDYYKGLISHDAGELLPVLQPYIFSSDFQTNLIEELNSLLHGCFPEDDFVKLLSRHLNYVTQQDLDALLNVAAENTRIAECRYLIDLDSSIDFEDTASLLVRSAIQHRDWESLKCFVNSGVDPRIDENFAVSCALMYIPKMGYGVLVDGKRGSCRLGWPH